MRFHLIFLAFLFNAHYVLAQSNDVLLFSYFKGNGEDGLHLASSVDGFTWKALNNDQSLLKPMVGKEKLIRDPCIIAGQDGRFHMVWTASWQDKGIGYAWSEDLINWSEQKFLPVMQHESGALNCWAPEITYDSKKKEYLIYWATTIPGRFAAGDTSGDGKYNHRMYYVTTKDFNTFSKTSLLYDQGFSVIDATIVPSGNKYLMFLKDETKKPPQKNIRTAEAVNATGPYSSPSSPITGQYWAEGPTTAQVDGKWIVYFDKYTLHSMGAVTSGDGKTWTDISDKVSFPPGTRHGSVLRITSKQYKTLQDKLRTHQF